MKGATCISSLVPLCPAHFNPRTHEGCDVDMQAFKESGAIISIHAPMKGATEIKTRLMDYLMISIHAPMKGATRVPCVFLIALSNFNPRTHEGCDSNPRKVTIQ